MAQAFFWYFGMAASMALWLIIDVPAQKRGEWLALIGLSLVWPATVAYAVYCAIKQKA
jgi:hypothetical protein